MGHLHPFRPTNPGVGGERTDTKEVSLTAISASLYAVLSVGLAPFSFGPVQLRIADCILPLAALFGRPLIAGATIGCLVGNIAGGVIAFGTVNLLDVTFGPVANFIATSLIFVLRGRRLICCVLGSLAIGVIVGSYLWTFIPPPEILGLTLPPWMAMIISITLSSLVTMTVIGYFLLAALTRPNIMEVFKSRGLKVFEQE